MGDLALILIIMVVVLYFLYSTVKSKTLPFVVKIFFLGTMAATLIVWALGFFLLPVSRFTF